MDKVCDIHIQVYDKYLDAVGDFIEIVHAGDDMGTQNNSFYSPDLYKEMVYPYQKKLLQFIKQKTYAKIFFHSCGSISNLLDDMIDAGVDILNPVQHTAKNMNLKFLKQNFGDKLSFQGGIDQQNVLSQGTKKDIRTEVKNCIRKLAPGGGYILNAVHNIVPEVSGENLITMYKSAREYGKYPLSI
jgi:uroporphyrinogen decarboxylase